MFRWVNKLKSWRNKAKSDSIVVQSPKSLQEMFDVTAGSSAYSNDRDRPYDGQAHTVNGTRGKTKIYGITFRDLSDCYVKACFLAAGHVNPELYERVENGSWLTDDIYKIDFEHLDPIAISQNMCCEIEKLMGIYPNVPKLKQIGNFTTG